MAPAKLQRATPAAGGTLPLLVPIQIEIEVAVEISISSSRPSGPGWPPPVSIAPIAPRAAWTARRRCFCERHGRRRLRGP